MTGLYVQSLLKAFSEDNFEVAQKKKIFFLRLKLLWKKGINSVYKHVFLFPTMFSRGFFLGGGGGGV